MKTIVRILYRETPGSTVNVDDVVNNPSTPMKQQQNLHLGWKASHETVSTLTSAQKGVISRVMEILKDPILNKEIQKSFKDLFVGITENTKQYAQLIDKIDANSVTQLHLIEGRFQNRAIDQYAAKKESLEVIKNATIVKLAALKSGFEKPPSGDAGEKTDTLPPGVFKKGNGTMRIGDRDIP